MTNDLLAEEVLTLSEAAKSLHHRPHVSTLHRWRKHGVRGVKLETVTIGSRRFTSRQALERFSAATTAAADKSLPPTRTPTQRLRAIKAAETQIAVSHKIKLPQCKEGPKSRSAES